jgi:hypothetical protein
MMNASMPRAEEPRSANDAAHRHRWAGARRRIATASATILLVGAAACSPTRFETPHDVPPPLIEKIPVAVAVHLPLEFREQVYEEKRPGGGEYRIGLGKAQSAGFMRIMEAMFEKVTVVSSLTTAAVEAPGIRGVLQPELEDYAFITPVDSGMQAYAASLRYTIKLFSPEGRLAETWTFTGYGSQPASSFPGGGAEALQAATRLAMRDAAAKLAAEFREQAIARGLIGPGASTVPTEVVPPRPSPPTPPAAPPPAQPPPGESQPAQPEPEQPESKQPEPEPSEPESSQPA